jgi:hypothetical protein
MSQASIAPVVVALVVAFSAAAQHPGHEIYLNAPGAMSRLAHDNPAHYAKVEGIFTKLCEVPAEEVPGVVAAAFSARGVAYLPYLLVTDPPKKRLSFILDDTVYSAVVTLRTSSSMSLPAHCRIPLSDLDRAFEVIE